MLQFQQQKTPKGQRAAIALQDVPSPELPMKWQVNKLIAFGLVAAVFTAARYFG
jgi:hypothetical protein